MCSVAYRPALIRGGSRTSYWSPFLSGNNFNAALFACSASFGFIFLAWIFMRFRSRIVTTKKGGNLLKVSRRHFTYTDIVDEESCCGRFDFGRDCACEIAMVSVSKQVEPLLPPPPSFIAYQSQEKGESSMSM